MKSVVGRYSNVLTSREFVLPKYMVEVSFLYFSFMYVGFTDVIFSTLCVPGWKIFTFFRNDLYGRKKKTFWSNATNSWWNYTRYISSYFSCAFLFSHFALASVSACAYLLATILSFITNAMETMSYSRFIYFFYVLARICMCFCNACIWVYFVGQSVWGFIN